MDAMHRLTTTTAEPDCQAVLPDTGEGERNILSDKAYTSKNAGKWVAVERATKRPICVHSDLLVVDAKTQEKGYTEDEYLLLRVPA
jgi:hypothetical protein